MVMKEAVEDKKMELIQSGTKIPAKDIDVLYLIDTFELYGLINDGINKCNNRSTMQGFINDMLLIQMFLLWSTVVTKRLRRVN